MGEVVDLSVSTTLDVPAEKVLNAAMKADLSLAIVIGVGKDGTPYHAATSSDIGEIILRLEMFKRQMLLFAADGGG